MTAPKIITRRVYPPILSRQFDYEAHYEDREETGPYGYGRTEQAAISDLIDNYEAPNE